MTTETRTIAPEIATGGNYWTGIKPDLSRKVVVTCVHVDDLTDTYIWEAADGRQFVDSPDFGIESCDSAAPYRFVA